MGDKKVEVLHRRPEGDVVVLMVEDEAAESIVMEEEESKRFMENLGTCRSAAVYCKGHDKYFGNQASTTVCFALVIFLLYRPFSFTVYASDVLIR